MEHLYQILISLGYPVAYGQFISPVTPPFITYQFNASNDIYFDNQNSVTKGTWQIELYTEIKDRTIEKALEEVLKTNGLTYTKYEAWIDDENLWQEVYLVEIMEG
jgi:hypothetical protein